MEIKNPGGAFPIEKRPAPDYRNAWSLPEQIVKSWFGGYHELAEKEFGNLHPIPIYATFFNDSKHHTPAERDAAIGSVNPRLLRGLDELVYRFNGELLNIKLNKDIDRLKWFCDKIERLIPKAPQWSKHLKPEK